MEDNRGMWVGFLISSLCLAVIALVLYTPLMNSGALNQVFGRFCHQITDRCYDLEGTPLPVCVRCIWIYVGFAIGHTVFVFWKPQLIGMTRALIGVIALMMLDVALEWLGLYHNFFWTRALTGFLFCLVVSYFTLLGLREIVAELNNPFSYVRSKFLSSRPR